MSDFSRFETLNLEFKENILFLSINRPDKLNALNRQVLSELKDLFENDLNKEKTCKGVILFGQGEKAFIAGADIQSMSSMEPHDAREFARLGQEVTLLMENLELPIIAAVDGFALGGGCEMSMSCDFIYATEKSLFGQPEVNLGLIPGFGGTQRLARYIGRSRAKELIYTGKNFSASDGAEWGLVARVFKTRQEMMDEAFKTLSVIGQKSSLIIGRCKKVINNGESLSLDEALEIERQGFMSIFDTYDTKEGMKAFLEKRKPSFKGE